MTLCEAGGHNFTQTTSTGLEFRCIVHDICKRPALSHNVSPSPPPAAQTLSPTLALTHALSAILFHSHIDPNLHP